MQVLIDSSSLAARSQTVRSARQQLGDDEPPRTFGSAEQAAEWLQSHAAPGATFAWVGDVTTLGVVGAAATRAGVRLAALTPTPTTLTGNVGIDAIVDHARYTNATTRVRVLRVEFARDAAPRFACAMQLGGARELDASLARVQAQRGLLARVTAGVVETARLGARTRGAAAVVASQGWADAVALPPDPTTVAVSAGALRLGGLALPRASGTGSIQILWGRVDLDGVVRAGLAALPRTLAADEVILETDAELSIDGDVVAAAPGTRLRITSAVCDAFVAPGDPLSR